MVSSQSGRDSPGEDYYKNKNKKKQKRKGPRQMTFDRRKGAGTLSDDDDLCELSLLLARGLP